MHRVAILVLFGLAFALPACGQRGSLTFVEEVPADAVVETVLVSTVRTRVEGQPVFDARRSDGPAFAEFRVAVPPDRETGSVTFPSEYPPNPRTDFVTVSARQLAGEAGFIAAINRELAADPRSENTAAIFTHGYNTNFAEGLYRQTQLQHDYESHAAAVHFAWPSAGTAQGYIYDRESALYSRLGLEATLAAMARSNATKINVLAHSMGGFLTMDALATMARVGHDQFFEKVNAILLLSPDIEIDVFRQQARQVLARGVPIFVVVSDRDRALLVSARIRGERERVGSIRSPEELGDIDVTVIDLSDIEAGDAVGHFAIATSPELIDLLRGFRRQGTDIIETDRQQGVLRESVRLLQQGTEIVFSPILPPAR
jgi:esterase/lipase superfamily enzyme